MACCRLVGSIWFFLLKYVWCVNLAQKPHPVSFSTVQQWDNCGISFLILLVRVGCALIPWNSFFIGFIWFGNKKDNNSIWECEVWFAWLERNAIFMRLCSSFIVVLRDRVVNMTSHWCLADGIFKGTPYLMQRDWHLFYNIRLLGFLFPCTVFSFSCWLQDYLSSS